MKTQMLNRAAILAFASMIVASCSAVPEFRSDTRVRVKDVVRRVECELQLTLDRYTKKLPELKSWPLGYTLTVRVETEVGPSASVDWVIPYHLSDTFTLAASAGLTNTTLREGAFTFRFSPKSKHDCSDYLGDPHAMESYGTFGIQEWVENIAQARSASKFSDAKTFDYTLKFVIVANASGKPGFKIVNLTGTLGLSGKRTDTHTLAIAIIKSTGLKIQGVDLDSQRLDQQLDNLRLRDLLRP